MATPEMCPGTPEGIVVVPCHMPTPSPPCSPSAPSDAGDADTDAGAGSGSPVMCDSDCATDSDKESQVCASLAWTRAFSLILLCILSAVVDFPSCLLARVC